MKKSNTISIIRSGRFHGATDEFVEDEVNVCSLWAAVQHQLGVNLENVAFHFAGRDYRLSDVEGHVVSELIS